MESSQEIKMGDIMSLEVSNPLEMLESYLASTRLTTEEMLRYFVETWFQSAYQVYTEEQRLPLIKHIKDMCYIIATASSYVYQRYHGKGIYYPKVLYANTTYRNMLESFMHERLLHDEENQELHVKARDEFKGRSPASPLSPVVPVESRPKVENFGENLYSIMGNIAQLFGRLAYPLLDKYDWIIDYLSILYDAHSPRNTEEYILPIPEVTGLDSSKAVRALRVRHNSVMKHYGYLFVLREQQHMNLSATVSSGDNPRPLIEDMVNTWFLCHNFGMVHKDQAQAFGHIRRMISVIIWRNSNWYYGDTERHTHIPFIPHCLDSMKPIVYEGAINTYLATHLKEDTEDDYFLADEEQRKKWKAVVNETATNLANAIVYAPIEIHLTEWLVTYLCSFYTPDALNPKYRVLMPRECVYMNSGFVEACRIHLREMPKLSILFQLVPDLPSIDPPPKRKLSTVSEAPQKKKIRKGK
jgi:hypothetical protein